MKNKWFKLSDKIRFAIIGIVNALFAYFLYAIFLIILGQDCHQLALVLAWIFSSITSFLTHRYFVFRSKGKIIKEYLKCCSTWVVAYFINAILLEIFVSIFCLNPYVAQVIAPAIAGIFTYFAFKKVAFKN